MLITMFNLSPLKRFVKVPLNDPESDMLFSWTISFLSDI